MYITGNFAVSKQISTTDNLFTLPEVVPCPSEDKEIEVGLMCYPELTSTNSTYLTIRITPDGACRVNAPIQVGVKCSIRCECIVDW